MAGTRDEVGFGVPPGSDAGRRRAPWAGRVPVALLLVLGLLAGGWWWSHPDAMGGYGNVTGITRPVADVGRPFHYGQLLSPRSTEIVRLAGARPRVRRNTADARVRVRVCTAAPGRSVIGAVGGWLAPYCERLRPPGGASIRLAPEGRDYLVLTIIPRRSGRVRVDGIDVTYRRDLRHLFQRGTEQVGTESWLRIIP